MRSPAARDRTTWELLFGPWSVAVSAVVLAGAGLGLMLPGFPGYGIDLCWFHRTSGLPCVGCGLTRSVLDLARGRPLLAFSYHPFGLLVLPWALAAGSSPFWPRGLRGGLRAWFGGHERQAKRAYTALLAAFIGFGVVRLVLVLLGVWHFS